MTDWRVAPVLAGAYRGKKAWQRPLLTHMAGHLDGKEIVLCNRVDPESLADPYAEAGELTCPECIRRWAKLQAKSVT